MAAILRSLLVAFLLLSSCHCSPTTELLGTITRLLTDCSRFYPHASDRNMAKKLIVRLEVVVDSVRHLVDLLDRNDQANDKRIPHLESLVRQLQILLNRWEMFAIRAVSCTSLRLTVRVLPGVSATPNPRVGRPAYEISIPQLEFLRNRMRFNWSQITRMLLVSRTTLWRRVRNMELFSLQSRYTTISDSDLDE